MIHVHSLKKEEASEEKREKMRKGIQTMSHPAIWQEMKRQRHHVEELRELFEAAPEALEW